MNISKLKVIVVSLAALAVAAACALPNSRVSSPAMSVSVSHDGQYVISSHRDNKVIVWDIEERESRTLSTSANIYSAGYSITDQNYYWQDLDGRLHISGHSNRFYPEDDLYSHALDGSQSLFAYSNETWHIVVIQDGVESPLKMDGRGPGFPGVGKVVNLELSSDGSRLISAGRGVTEIDDIAISGNPAVAPERRRSLYAGTVIWDLGSLEPIAKLSGHSAKTHATFSPDGNYVVSVDENGLGFVWDAYTGDKEYALSHLNFGEYVGGHSLGSQKNWDDSGLHLKWPDDYPEDFNARAMVAVRFVSETEFMVLYTYSRYATLYQLGDPHARKVLDLGNYPHPSTGSYARNTSIASAPEAGILVTGQQSGNGINVYRFDEESKELEKIWAPRR